MGSPPPTRRLDEAASAAVKAAYYQVLFPLCICLSLISSCIMLVWTVRRRRQLIAATRAYPWWAEAQYSSMRRHFDVLVSLGRDPRMAADHASRGLFAWSHEVEVPMSWCCV